jgi:GxxExxY protein
MHCSPIQRGRRILDDQTCLPEMCNSKTACHKRNVGGRVILELKPVEHVLPVYTAQTLTYLHLSGCEAGLLLNFGAPRLVDGIRRFIP